LVEDTNFLIVIPTHSAASRASKSHRACIVVAGKIFKYGAQGPGGLARNKRVIVAISGGGFYVPGTPAAPLEHLEIYLRGIFGFIGVTRLEFISADGAQVSQSPAKKRWRVLQAATKLQAA
jgi:FMN-dependent NADH-azoreductase